MMDLSPWLTRLVTTLSNLAAEPAAQKAYLTSIGTEGSADELALEFDDVYRVLQPRLAHLNVPESAVHKLVQLDGLLKGMSGVRHSDLWTPEALQTSGTWSEVRRLATDVLSDLDGEHKLESDGR